jgi:DNA repair protein SbcD/Mre11
VVSDAPRICRGSLLRSSDVKILHTSDWHVGRRIRGRDRSEEHRQVLSEIASLAGEHRVDLTLVAGDVFDTSSPTPGAEEIVWRALLDLADIAPVLVVSGNHDSPARLNAISPLLEMSRINVVGAPAKPDEGGVIHLDGPGVKVAMLPCVSQRGIVKVEDMMQSDPDQHAGMYAERMKRIVTALTEGMTPDTINLLVSHLTVFGAEPGGGERQAHIFGYAVPAGLFPGHLNYVALGHLHRQQKVAHAGQVWYSGSPLQLDFGEVDDRKGVLLVDAEAGKPARVTTIPLTSGRRLMTLRGRLEEVLSRVDETGDAYVKVILTEKGRVGLADEVRAVIPNTVDVVLESPEQRPQRAPDDREALPPTEAFHRYLAEHDQDDPTIEELFAELLEEAMG